MSRLRILIVAYACSPYRGSEPGMGWCFVSEISKYHDVTVIVEEEKFKHEIDAYLKDTPTRIQFYFIKKVRHRRLRKLWPPSYYWFYQKWHIEAYKLAKKLHHKQSFDLFHQLNMVGFREPGYLWKIDAPFVWGPVGGFNQFPLQFLGCIGFSGAIHYLGRNFINTLQQRFSSRPKLAAIKADTGLIAATSYTRDRIKHLWNLNSRVLCEVGAINSTSSVYTHRSHNEPLRITWSGLHIHRKALPLLLKALGLINKEIDFKLDVLGEGPLTSNWKSIAKKNGIDGRCLWHGWLAKEEAIDVLHQSHLFVITSLSDLTSTVTLEALSSGLPIICLDHCGFTDVVTEHCGVKIPLSTPSKVSVDIAAAIIKIESDENLRQQLAIGAIERAKDYSWQSKMDVLNEIYQSVLSRA